MVPSKAQNEIAFTVAPAESRQPGEVQFPNFSSNFIRFINASKLKRIPAVIRDLSVALNESTLQEEYLSERKGLTIYLNDFTSNSFEISAAVQHQRNDTIYHLKLNRFNQQATDMALAATLIHEIMHCVLMDIFERAVQGEQKAIEKVRAFGPGKRDSTYNLENDFFYLMNKGNAGNHELMSRFFYPQMVSLLERFAIIHKDAFYLNKKITGPMMWTGLQNTNAYKKLNDNDKRNIQSTILEEKGINYEND